MTKQQDQISIIMPAYNASAFIKDSIETVLQQTYRNWELIVIDDGSTDDTPTIVRELRDRDDRIIYHRQENRRLGPARNTGFRLAAGTWIAFLDADDLWMCDKLEIQMEAATSHHIPVDIIFTAGYYLTGRGAELKPYDSLSGFYTGQELYPVLMKHNYIPVLSVMIRRTFLRQIGWQDTEPIVYGNEDWDYWLRASRAGGRFLGLKQRLFKYRVHNSAMSAKRATMITAGCYVICKNYKKVLLSPSDRLYHQTELLEKIPFISKRILKTGFSSDLISLLFRMISIAFPVLFALKKKQK
ncbi:glycosyltransferase family A protein [Mucilaginibacter sp. cycad4]|uniref:glycosyltransferase family 2 protein n=1 Tax=Mucilaginibacter sp. cycad4 TaxID=3342096 RepID=UPI002AABB62F|nr:glycosyltransferase family A protein [Mucilaginibacter gossypii]WPU98342.1 glycosyltransferase family A protein [Mucilaginibacter gossypii]